MIRSLFFALVAVFTLSVGTPAEQPQTQVPLDFSGGTPGIQIDVYMNGGKVGDTMLNTTGSGDFVLDLANLGKTRVDIYVDVCKDGKIVKVLFVTGGGQAPPEDEGCNRRIAAVSFQSDCGVTRINLDFRNFGARIIGCAAFYTKPQFYGPVAGAAVLVPFLAGGGGDSNTVTTTPPPVTTTNPQPTTPATPAPPANPAPTTPAPVNITGSFQIVFVVHGSNTSRICGIVQAQGAPSGTTYVITANGPAVLPGQNITGSFNSNGQSAFSVGIGNFGTYTLMMNMTAPNNGGSGTASATVNVTSSGQSQCPTVPA
jgi:hypothetical protein